MLKKKITFIGPGVMAEAMIAGLLHKKLAQPDEITVSGPREERGGRLSGGAPARRKNKGSILFVAPDRLAHGYLSQ